MLVSLDGYIESSNGDKSWAFPDAELHRHLNGQENAMETLLYGRRMYEEMAPFWSTLDQDDANTPDYIVEFAQIWKSKEKIVFSNTLDHADWGCRLFHGDTREELLTMKSGPGGDMSVGGAGLAGSLLNMGLIDELKLYMFPIILGSGKAVIPPLHDNINLQLSRSQVFTSGVVMLHYLVRNDL